MNISDCFPSAAREGVFPVGLSFLRLVDHWWSDQISESVRVCQTLRKDPADLAQIERSCVKPSPGDTLNVALIEAEPAAIPGLLRQAGENDADLVVIRAVGKAGAEVEAALLHAAYGGFATYYARPEPRLNVSIEGGRSGTVTIEESGNRISFNWDYSNRGVEIEFPPPKHWRAHCRETGVEWATNRREDLRTAMRQASRDLPLHFSN